MDKIEICKKIRKTIRKIVLFGKDDTDKDYIGWGTAAVVNDAGTLLTANHVVEKYSELSNPKIVAYGLDDVAEIEYKPKLFNVSLNINIPNIAYPLSIDLAVLIPVKEIKDIPYLELENEIISEGADIIMAGFPDEVSPPLNFNRMLNFNHPDLLKNKHQIDIFFKVLMRLIMIKSGMVGGVQKVNLNNCTGFGKIINAEGAVYWIDNVSNHGASGGPVVNSCGKLIGIICEKGITQQKVANDLCFDVPSGATMALSHQLITWGL